MGIKKFPKIKRGIENYINDEEGNITRNKLLTIGSMIVLMGVIFSVDAFADHASHSSHSSSSYTKSYHASHDSHSSHASHSSSTESHSSHSSNLSSSYGSNSSSGTESSGTSSSSTTPAVTLPKTSEIGLPNIPQSNNFVTTLPTATTVAPIPPKTPEVKI